MKNKIMKKAIKLALDNNLDFDFINNVFSCKALGEEIKGIWLWFGEINLVLKDETHLSAGEMDKLQDIEFDNIQGEYVFTMKRED